MSRKPIFSQTQQQPGLQPSKQPDTRGSQMFTKELSSTGYDKNNIQTFSGMNSIGVLSTAHVSTHQDMMGTSQAQSRIMTIDDVYIQKVVREMLQKENFGQGKNTLEIEQLKRDQFNLMNQIKENQKAIEMIRAVYFDQKNQQLQQITQILQDKIVVQMQQFEKSVFFDNKIHKFSTKIINASEQLVQHQENFQTNYEAKFTELRNQIELTKQHSSIHDGKLAKCMLKKKFFLNEIFFSQFIAKLEDPSEKLNELNSKMCQIEQNFNSQLKLVQTTQIQQSFKKMLEQIETQFKEIYAFIDSRTFNVNDVKIDIVDIKQSIQSLEQRQLNSESSIYENNQILSKEKIFYQNFKDIMRQNLVQLELENKENRVQQKNFVYESQNKASEQQCLFSFNQGFQELKKVPVQIKIQNNNEDEEYNYSQNTSEKKKNSYTIQSEQIESETDDGRKNMSFQNFLEKQRFSQQEVARPNHLSSVNENTHSLQIPIVEYTENKFIEEEDDFKSPVNQQRIKTESDVVEIGTTKGDNKESLLERLSEMRRLPEIPEIHDLEQSNVQESLSFPVQPQNSIAENFITQTNVPLTESEFNCQVQRQSMDKVSENDDTQVEVTYQLDENGYLMDENDQYILDEDGNMIQLDEQQIDFLKQRQVLRDE